MNRISEGHQIPNCSNYMRSQCHFSSLFHRAGICLCPRWLRQCRRGPEQLLFSKWLLFLHDRHFSRSIVPLHSTSQGLLGTQKLCLPLGVLMRRSLVGHEISSPSMSQQKCHVLRKWNEISCLTCLTGQANTVLEELLKGPQVCCRWVNS